MRRIERLINLVALLVETNKPLSLNEIVDRVPGYEAETPSALRRSFERDKETIREMGIELRTESIDRFVGPGPDNVGYTIPSTDQVPDPGLTVAERAALGVATAYVWGDAGAGLDERSSGRPVLRAGDGDQLVGHVEALLGAVMERCRVSFEYRSAAAADASTRMLHPYGVANRRGRWYVAGFDTGVEGLRAFRIDRILGEISVGGRGAFSRPADFRISDIVRDRAWAFGDGPTRIVDVAVRPDDLWRIQGQIDADDSGYTAQIAGVDWPVTRVSVRNVEVFITWVLSMLDSVVVVAPRHVAATVESELTSLGRGIG